LSLQAGLRGVGPVNTISLMTALATLVSIAAGIAGFGESLGGNAAITALHVLAIAVVLACVRPLAEAEAHIEDVLSADAGPAAPVHAT
jgi:hypothetical protein